MGNLRSNKGRPLFLAFLFSVIIVETVVGQETSYEVKGTISGEFYGKIYLFFDNNYRQKDSLSTEIKDGQFIFRGKVKKPALARLHLDQESYIQDFFIDGNTVWLTCETHIGTSKRPNGQLDTLNQLTITGVEGSPTETRKRAFEHWLDSLRTSGAGEDTINLQYYAGLLSFLKENPNSIVGPYLIGHATTLTYYQVKTLVDKIDPRLNSTYAVSTVTKLLHTLEETQHSFIGTPFHDVNLPDTLGAILNTQRFRGKYVLFDFWASWCVPCRNFSPELVRLHNKYAGSSFEIVGISWDTDRKKWKDAIYQDHLAWTQLIDTRGARGDLGDFYALDAIPSTILIDQEGRILGVDLSGEDIEKAIKTESIRGQH